MRAQALILMLAAACPAVASAGTAVIPMQVEANVVLRCQVDAPDLDFGVVSVPTAPVDKQMNITVRCSALLNSWELGIELGGAARGDQRRLIHTGGSGTSLQYGLFRAAARGTTDRWETAAPYTRTGFNLLGWSTTSTTVYARLYPGQSVPAGTFQDTVRAVLRF